MIKVSDHNDYNVCIDNITISDKRVDVDTVNDNIGSNFNKCGSFEWIISSFEEINKYLHVEYIGINMNTIDTKVLVIGCGTSEISENIVKRYELCSVVSIDNDIDCINYMKNKTMMMKPCNHDYHDSDSIIVLLFLIYFLPKIFLFIQSWLMMRL
jgi:ubiquinone/menaquinone biosynthesis C-methylase UbiE